MRRAWHVAAKAAIRVAPRAAGGVGARGGVTRCVSATSSSERSCRHNVPLCLQEPAYEDGAAACPIGVRQNPSAERQCGRGGTGAGTAKKVCIVHAVEPERALSGWQAYVRRTAEAGENWQAVVANGSRRGGGKPGRTRQRRASAYIAVGRRKKVLV